MANVEENNQANKVTESREKIMWVASPYTAVSAWLQYRSIQILSTIYKHQSV